jgi:hypothetical protein
MQFDPSSAESIRKAQKCFKNAEIKNYLIYISSNFQVLTETITKLEKTGSPLTESVSMVDNVLNTLKMSPGENARKAFLKLQSVLEKNPDFSILQSVAKISSGGNGELSRNITPETGVMLKYAPVTSCDVERSFSAYKMVLSDRRHRLTPENLEKNMLVYCNSKHD